LRLEVEAEVKPRELTKRDGGGERAREELWLECDCGDWSDEERGVPEEERFPMREDDVGVGVPGGLTGSRLAAGRVGVVGAGEEERV
jgi:hypothetical protein